MLHLDEKGREVNPYLLYRKALTRALDDWAQFESRAGDNRRLAQVKRGTATRIRQHIRKPINTVITSPPYHNAVDYYRRHTLEMYWLDLVNNRGEQLLLRPQYIGRNRVAKSDPVVSNSRLTSDLAVYWETKFASQNPQRAADFKHYVLSMMKCLTGIGRLLDAGRHAIFVVGQNSWNGHQLPTVDLFNEMAAPQFHLVEQYWYPIKNRYMTYSRHNNANINKEYILVYEKL